MTASPLVRVQFSSDPSHAWNLTSGGLNVDPGDTISIRLDDTLDVGSWYLTVLGVDEETADPPVLVNVSTNPDTPGLVISPTSTVSFTVAEWYGQTYILKSSVNGPSNSTTFGIFVRTAEGFRIGAIGERFEGDPVFGWTATINQFIRNGGGSGGPASALRTTTLNVDVAGSAAPSTGEVLTAVDSTHATWQAIGVTQIPWSATGNIGSDEVQPSEIAPSPNYNVFFDTVGDGNPLSIVTDRLSVRAVALKPSPNPLNPEDFDGVTLVEGDRVLVVREAAFSGILVFSGGTFSIFDPPWMTCGFQVYVTEGEIYGGKTFRQVTPGNPSPSFPNQVWKCELGPDIAPPLTTIAGSEGGVSWQVFDSITGPPSDGYDLILVTDNVATNTSTGGNLQRERGAVTYHLAGGVLTLSDDSRSLTSANYFRQVISGNLVQIQVGRQSAGNNYSFRVRAWFEYVRSI
jgi:hypothetical protein